MGYCLSRPRRPPPSPDDQLVLPVQHFQEIDNVFQNDLLLDLILTKVILKPLKDRKRNDTFSKAEARTLRQVCRRWMVSISFLFFRAREPLIYFEVTHAHVSPHPIRDLMTMIGFRKSTLYTGSSSGRLITLPPISLTLTKVSRSRRSFFKSLMVFCQGSLVQLRIRDRSFFNQRRLPSLPSNLRFPALHKVTLKYSDRFIAETKYITHFDAFIQRILFQAVELREFSYEVEQYNHFPIVPVYVFPQTLTHLQTFTASGSKLKPTTITNPLQPPLRQFSTLKILNMRLECQENLCKFLSVVNTSLEHLCVECPWENGRELQMEMRRIPVLPKLKMLELEGPLIMGVSGTETIKEPKCPSVQSLTLPLGGSIQESGKSWTPVPLQTMIQIQLNFPCVAAMHVIINWDSKDGLKNLFRVMGVQLRNLTVQFQHKAMEYNGGGHLQHLSNEWHTLFLGTTPDMVLVDRNSLERFIKEEKYLLQSIRNLKNLHKFIVTGSPFTPPIFNDCLTWELIFHLAFCMLPQLKHLTIGGSFQVSQEIVQRWVTGGNGRTIDYQPSLPLKPL